MRENGGRRVNPEAILAGLLIVSILLIIYSRFFNGPNIKNKVIQMVLGVQSFVGTSVNSMEDAVNSIANMKKLRQEYKNTLEKLIDYKSLEQENFRLKMENARLEQQFGYRQKIKYRNVPARIIAHDPSNLFSTITLNKGSDDNVKIDMAVTAFQDGLMGLLGKVVAVSIHTSQVRSIIDPDNYVAARLERLRFEGLISGRGGNTGTLLMKYVQKSLSNTIPINELVVTSGMQSLYPENIYIGRVKEVRAWEYLTTIELVVTPIIQPKNTEYVFIIMEDL